jgi:hypothetical protein
MIAKYGKKQARIGHVVVDHWGNRSIRAIARKLGRSPASVSRELRRNYPKEHKVYNPASGARTSGLQVHIDYAMLIKIYGAAPEGQRRYSPAICTGARKQAIEGNPDPKHISTSFSARQNLNIRMGNRRMTRLTNAFSKKAENHAHMMAIYFMHYNFVRIHQTLKITPAMAAGITPRLWEMSDMVNVLEAWEASNI